MFHSSEQIITSESIMRHLVILLITSGFFATNADKIECGFVQDTLGYKCNVLDMNNYFITGVNGNHLPGQSNADVLYFEATSKTLEFIPQGIHDQFPNVKSLKVNFIKLAEVIDEDLKPFGANLTFLSITNSSIDVIPSNIFASTPSINYMYLASPNLKNIETGVFEQLQNLNGLFVQFPCESEDAISRDAVKNLVQNLEIRCHNQSFPFEPKKRPQNPNSGMTQKGSVIMITLLMSLVLAVLA